MKPEQKQAAEQARARRAIDAARAIGRGLQAPQNHRSAIAIEPAGSSLRRRAMSKAAI